MVVQDFPAAKLLMLLLRQVSKPVSDFIKTKANDHPMFRSYVCMPPAYFYNWCDVKVKMRLMDVGKPVKVPQMKEAVAIELGSQILGEGIIFFMAAFLICSEYARQMRNEEKKEEMTKEELYRLHYKIDELTYQLEQQVTKIQGLHYTVHEIDNRQSDSFFSFGQKPKQLQEITTLEQPHKENNVSTTNISTQTSSSEPNTPSVGWAKFFGIP